MGRNLDDALRLETINSYSNLGDFQEASELLAEFYKKSWTAARDYEKGLLGVSDEGL